MMVVQWNAAELGGRKRKRWAAAAQVPSIGSADLIGRVASFLAPGPDLAGLLVAVGPTDAGRVRRGYLLDNERYLTDSIRVLSRALASFRAGDATVPVGAASLAPFCSQGPALDKCRDNVRAWMAVNRGWRRRCNRSGLERCKTGTGTAPARGGPTASDVFNNPAVAAELGLTEVLEYLVNDLGAGPTTAWTGLVRPPPASRPAPTLLRLALARGDATAVDVLLSSDAFVWRSDRQDRTMRFAISSPFCGVECFRALVAHVDVNGDWVLVHGGVSPLRCAVDWFGHSLGVADGLLSLLVEGKIAALLAAGADPRSVDEAGGGSALDEARAELALARRPASHRRWRALVGLLEGHSTCRGQGRGGQGFSC